MSDEARSEKVHIYSGEWGAYWRPEGAGYTQSVAEAGVWTREEAERKTSHCDAEKKVRLVPEVVSEFEKLLAETMDARFVDHIQGSNCAEWECRKCGEGWVSPSKLPCPKCAARVGLHRYFPDLLAALAAARSEAGAAKDVLAKLVGTLEPAVDYWGVTITLGQSDLGVIREAVGEARELLKPSGGNSDAVD